MAVSPDHPVTPLYAVTIHKCITEGELQKMKSLSAEAAKHVADVSAALTKLDAEIAKVENQPGA